MAVIFRRRHIPRPKMSMPRIEFSGPCKKSSAPCFMTISELQEIFGPAKTLGCPDEVRIAQDSALEACGHYSLLQHGIEMGGLPFGSQFLGYGTLQALSQNGLIRACVETVADDMVRSWIELKRKGKADHEDPELLNELVQTADTFNLRKVFHEAVELVGYEGGSYIFIDTGVPYEQLVEPLLVGKHSSELKKDARLRFVALDPVNVSPGDYNAGNPLADDYYRPRYYWVSGHRVHSSRLVRLVANEVPTLLKPSYNFLGIPQAQILYDYVLHFQETRAAEARLLTKFSMTVFKTNMEAMITGGDSSTITQLNNRVKFMLQNMNNDGVLLVDKELEDVIKLETPLSGVTDIVRQALEFLACVNRTPAVKLLGISPAGFNSTGESDLRNYYDHILSQQEKVMRGGIARVLDCLQMHLRGDIDETVTFEFKPLSEEDQSMKTNLRKIKADTLAVYLDRDIISQEEARKALADDPDSGFEDIEPEDVPEGELDDFSDDESEESPAAESAEPAAVEPVTEPEPVVRDFAPAGLRRNKDTGSLFSRDPKEKKWAR